MTKKEQEKWEDEADEHRSRERDHLRDREDYFQHLNSSSFMPPTVPRSMTPRKRHPAEKRMLKRTNSMPAGQEQRKQAGVSSKIRHRPPGESLFFVFLQKDERVVSVGQNIK